MKIIEPSYEILYPCALDAVTHKDAMAAIARAARTCYKSQGTHDAALVEQIIRNGHEAMAEHYAITVRFITDRGVSHEIVRHRIASYAQESTRYCSYDKKKFGSEITVVRPAAFEEGSACYKLWRDACEAAEWAYFALLKDGATPELARDVLPMSLKTELVVTMNLREWRHFFRAPRGWNDRPSASADSASRPASPARACRVAPRSLRRSGQADTQGGTQWITPPMAAKWPQSTGSLSCAPSPKTGKTI